MSKVAFWCNFFVFVVLSIVACQWIKTNYPDFFYTTAVSLGIKQDQEENQNQDNSLETGRSYTGPNIPEQNKPEQPGSDIKPPIFGLPGFNLPNPLPGSSQPQTTETPKTNEQQPLETLNTSGTGLTPPSLQSPSDVLKACVDKLKTNDIVGAERYVSPNGLTFTLGTTIGVHEVLWKGLYQVQAYQAIGYDAAKISGQTALVPLYANLGENRVAIAYVVMAHRGDGWN